MSALALWVGMALAQAPECVGTLVLHSEPAQAHVEVDGVEVRTDGRPIPLACGEHGVSARLDRHSPAFLNVDIEEGQTTDLDVVLLPLGEGVLQVRTTPADAAVYVDGAWVGGGPALSVAPILAGGHVVEARAEGFAVDTRQIILGDGEMVELEFDLRPIAPSPSASLAQPPARSGSGTAGLRWAGVGTAGVGALMVGVAAVDWLSQRPVYEEYRRLVAEANAGTTDAAVAEGYYRDEIQPVRGRLHGLGAVGGTLLAGGVTMAVVF